MPTWLHATEQSIELGSSLYTQYIRFEVRIAAERSAIEEEHLRIWYSKSAGNELSNNNEVPLASIVIVKVGQWRGWWQCSFDLARGEGGGVVKLQGTGAEQSSEPLK